MNCRHCSAELNLSLVNLGSAPPSNAYLTKQKLHTVEKWFPLSVLVCTDCWLVQTEDFTQADELFDAEYAYFSGFSSSWLEHSERYVNEMVEKYELDAESHVVEVAANDGYLLQYVQKIGIPCTGVEPTASTAAVARQKGLFIVEEFFGKQIAGKLVDQGKQADLTVANNVLAHVPDINDFVAGFAMLLKPEGVSTFEFPHLLNLVSENQFDTIYHEHFSYLSLTAVNRIFSANGLSVFDVEQLPTHGGSLRVYAQRSDTRSYSPSDRVNSLLSIEAEAGIASEDFYLGFQQKTDQVKNDFLSFLIKAKEDGKSVAAYGAAAKGNTLMNYAGVRPDLIPFIVDRSHSKQNKYMPGSRIPILDEKTLLKVKPNFVVLLPWNLETELVEQLDYIREWGGQFVVAVPHLRVI